MDTTLLKNIDTDVNNFLKTDRIKDILQLYKMELLRKTDLSQLEPIKELLQKHHKLMKSLKEADNEKVQ